MEIMVTPDAANELKKIIKEKNTPDVGIRIYASGCMWGSAAYGLALVVPTDNDSIIESEGIKFVVEKELAKSVRGIIVDYRMVASDKKLIVRPLSYSH